eukprot:scaffold55422_cov27-Tisochrysis_lutea.AAC.1
MVNGEMGMGRRLVPRACPPFSLPPSAFCAPTPLSPLASGLWGLGGAVRWSTSCHATWHVLSIHQPSA